MLYVKIRSSVSDVETNKSVFIFVALINACLLGRLSIRSIKCASLLDEMF